VLHLRVFGNAPAMDDVVGRLAALPGAEHVTRTHAGDHSDRVLVTADLDAHAADAALAVLSRLGVAPSDVWLLRLDGIQPGHARRPESAVVWADLVGQAAIYSRPVARFLAFMAVAGVIAAYGVLYSNSILIVGAMAVSPDFLPIAATCIGIARGRKRLATYASVTLGIGLAVTGVTAALLTAVLDLLGELPDGFVVGENGLSGLTTVNSSTIVVAFVAGIAGILALETRASAAVGVAISVTTIPASAYLGVAAGVGSFDKASGAAAVLVVNVAMLVAGGTLTLLGQRALSR
jgi:uncharacterized hydrophobic protein (TIGR00271 family)